jgi:hypothetical protein
MDLSEHIAANQPLAESVCQRLTDEINKLGFSPSSNLQYPRYAEARFELIKDPYTSTDNLACYWYDARQQRVGRLQFNSDATFYAEYDVIKPHPVKSKWFVEGVTAWGKADHIKAEAKLLPMSEG